MIVSFAFILELAFEKLPFFRVVVALASVLTGLDSFPFGGAEDDGFEEEFRLCLVTLCVIRDEVPNMQLLDNGLLKRGKSLVWVENRTAGGRSILT